MPLLKLRLINHSLVKTWGRGSVVVKALCYKQEYRGFEARWGEWMFSIYLLLPAAPGSGVYSVCNGNKNRKQKNNFYGEQSAARL
jgi:hypothetical protein